MDLDSDLRRISQRNGQRTRHAKARGCQARGSPSNLGAATASSHRIISLRTSSLAKTTLGGQLSGRSSSKSDGHATKFREVDAFVMDLNSDLRMLSHKLGLGFADAFVMDLNSDLRMLSSWTWARFADAFFMD